MLCCFEPSFPKETSFDDPKDDTAQAKKDRHQREGDLHTYEWYGVIFLQKIVVVDDKHGG